MRVRRPALGWFAAALIAASLAARLLTVCLRALRATGLDLRVLEGMTLFLAAGAYLAYALAHHRNHRELVTRSILVSAFLLWGIVQLIPGLADVALLNDVVILLFVADLAFLLKPLDVSLEQLSRAWLGVRLAAVARRSSPRLGLAASRGPRSHPPMRDISTFAWGLVCAVRSSE